MKTDEIRSSFLNFFAEKGHSIIASDSLVPQNDPTLLFTGAGMNQFKEYFLGLKKDMSRAASAQKCLRTGDLDEVGRTAYHHSFFEMLGNFSFGDYFKREAIAWAWEYLTQVLTISRDRLRISVHQSDDEAFRIWKDEIGIRPDWIYKMGDKSNFWPSNAPKDGPNGPCGPCSEIYYDMAADPLAAADSLESSRFAEIWNLVFTQFDRQDGGRLIPLANRNIDTGMGLERLACVLQGKKTNFEIDIFQPIHEKVKAGLKLPQEARPAVSHLYAISDHVRAVVFSMNDGVIPGNEGRSYVIRKLIRRALWHAHQIVPEGRLEDAFLYRIVPAVVQVMKGGYPELADSEASIVATLKAEEERFLDMLETGLRILNTRLDGLEDTGRRVLPGTAVFELYDTYGFPEELTRTIAENRGFQVDQEGFEEQMRLQRQRAKEASQIAGSIFVSSELEEQVLRLPKTVFLGYGALEAEGKVLLALIRQGEGIIVLDRTPFYGESGGQVGDQGLLEGPDFRAAVTDTQKKDDRILHVVKVQNGEIKAGDVLQARVDEARRACTMRNHTATHLLHAALRKTLGKQARQLGSLVSPEKLRFDYSYSQPLTAGEIRRIEDEVNGEILKDTEVSKHEKPVGEAKKEGAIAFFGEKYGERVRVVTVGDYSKELCGGTHCDRTGQIGSFVIVSDTSIASGTRRIEALTGEGALAYLRGLRSELGEIAGLLKTSPWGLRERIVKMQDKLKTLEREKKQGKAGAAQPEASEVRWKNVGEWDFGYCRFGAEGDAPQLRALSDELRIRRRNSVYFLAAENGEKIHYLLGMGPALEKSDLDLRDMFKRLAPVLQGSGGGRKDLVQGGARNENQLKTGWEQIVESAVAYLEERKP